MALLAPLVVVRPARRDATDEGVRSAGILVAFSLVAWLVTFLPLLTFPFLSDDYVFLDLYRDTASLTRAPQFFRPFFGFVFWLVAAPAGAAPAAYHILGFSLHVISSACIYVLARRLLLSPIAAAVCFSVFLLNPLQLEAVLWVAGLQESLWACGVLSGLVIYTAKRELTVWRLGATTALVSLALLSKETAICYVLLFPAADWVLFRFRRGRVLPVAYGAFAVLLVGYLVLRSRFVEMERSFLVTPSAYFAKQLATTPYRFFAMPWNADAVRVPPLVSFALSAGTTCLIFWSVVVRRESLGPAAGAFVILASTAPVYSYFFVREDLLSARYIYFASAGWALIVASSLRSVVRSTAAATAVGLLLASCMVAALRMNLAPWIVASEVVKVAERSLEEQRDPSEAVREWSAENRIGIEFNGFVPYEYRGVGIFINGFPEFVRRASER